MKKEIHKERLRTAMQKKNQIIGATNPDLSYAPKLARERGTSSWLNALPNKKHGLWLTKSEFRDALCIRYGWASKNVPSTCASGSPFVLFHTLHCPKGGYPIIRHNEIRDLSANLMKKFGHASMSNHICSLWTTRLFQTLPAPKMRQHSTSAQRNLGQ